MPQKFFFDRASIMKLYQYQVCPFCCKVRSVLDYEKIPYDIIEVNPLNKREIQFSSDYKKVPILIDDDKKIVESNDIIKYLADKYSKKNIFSDDSEKRDRQEKWLKFADQELVIMLPPNIYRTMSEAFKSFDYISNKGNFSAFQKKTIKYVGGAIMNMVAKKKIKEYNISDPRASLKEVLDKITKELKENSYLGGDHPDISDLACAGVLNSVRDLDVWEFIESETPKIHEWFSRVESQWN